MITRRKLLALAPLLLLPAQAQRALSKKKGSCSMGATNADKLNARWRYDWGVQGGSSPMVEFVPMVKGTPHFRAGYWEQVAGLKARGAKHLLGFNEPERKSQGDLTIAQALDLWPKLEATGLRLGSPAPSSDGGGMAWLREFMKEVKKRKLRVDFMAIHWYRSSDLAAFESWLKDLKHDFDRPVWLTEFNAWNADENTQERFLKGAVKILERLSFVERYAFFSPGTGKPGSLFKADGQLSELGEFYREL